MKKLNKVSLGIIALFTLPKIYAYQCQIDLQSNYTDSYLYINNNGDVYAIVNYDDHRYDEIEQVYEARSCRKISDGVRKKSKVRSVLDKNGFRELRGEEDLSPWLSHYYVIEQKNNRLIVSVNDIGSKKQQGLRELFAYSRDKGDSLSSEAKEIFNTKYVRTPQFKNTIISRYFQSKNFEKYAARIEQKLFHSPESLKDSVDLRFLISQSFKLVAYNSRNNEFKVMLKSEDETLRMSKIPTIVMKAECLESSLRNKRNRTIRGFWSFAKYDQEIADKTVTCTVNGHSSEESLKMHLSTIAKTLGISSTIKLNNHELGVKEKIVVLNERKITSDVSYSSTANGSSGVYKCTFQCEGRGGASRTGEITEKVKAGSAWEASEYLKKKYEKICAGYPFYPGGGGSAYVGTRFCEISH